MTLKLSRAAVDASPDANEAIMERVIDFLIETDHGEMKRPQWLAHVALLYDLEMFNGGHLQYFHNKGMAHVDDLLVALTEIGAECQRKILEQALAYAHEHPVERVRTLQEYSERATQLEFEELDRAYYECEPDIYGTLLPSYVMRNLSYFVEWE